MSSNYAGIHLLCEDYNKIIEKLKKLFGQKKELRQNEAMALELLATSANKRIGEIQDAKEKAEKQEVLSDVMRTMKNAMGDYGTITVVVRQHFVSIYGHDFIRSESVKDELKNFVEKLRVPGLGVALWQNYNFQIYAVSDVGNMPVCFGEYWFDEDDITPVDAESVCETICAPFMLSALQKVLTSKEGDEMAGVFEEETGLQIYMDDDMCRNENLEELYHSDKLTIFSALS